MATIIRQPGTNLLAVIDGGRVQLRDATPEQVGNWMAGRAADQARTHGTELARAVLADGSKDSEDRAGQLWAEARRARGPR